MSHINEALEEFFRKERIAEMEEMARNGEYVFDCETIKLVVKQDIAPGSVAVKGKQITLTASPK